MKIRVLETKIGVDVKKKINIHLITNPHFILLLPLLESLISSSVKIENLFSILLLCIEPIVDYYSLASNRGWFVISLCLEAVVLRFVIPAKSL